MKTKIKFLSMILVFSLVMSTGILSFANSDQLSNDRITNAISKIDNSPNKEKILQFLFTPLYVNMEDENNALQEQDIINEIEYLSSLTTLELDEIISERLTQIVQSVKTSPYIDPLNNLSDMVNEYCPEQLTILEEQAQEKANKQNISEKATAPDRNFTKVGTGSLNSAFGSVAKVMLEVKWSVRNGVISTFSHTTTYQESMHWTYMGSKTTRAELTNGNLFGTISREIAFMSAWVPTGTLCHVDCWFYTDGGCDFDFY